MPVKPSISILSMLIIIRYAQPKLEYKKPYEITIRTVAGHKMRCCQNVFETLILCFVSSLYYVFTVGLAQSV
jgi:cellobiose-specific phosphotransferase system component IIC